ncbi:RNA polymerase sigma factor [Amycolatopsis sp. FDAARGOS 1241]|uniref:RNA polymerase sigma factor n=1 Tax=Amycolatopsis sp. FDAARGOS 1241 TaxID=2778070 RepID=UPI001950D16C|nr:sigma-70 family RNA polymerase sigma factor [Amycolatopsis sp. FDAARGOS 1241]QRP48619.1 sigma-70 family RNA polymerase sigma factor [Amycolatopsis sp. FDAARGOS 1241]
MSEGGAADWRVEDEEWLRLLRSDGAAGEAGRRMLFELLLRFGRMQLGHRRGAGGLVGVELLDVVDQAVADAFLFVLNGLESFRGEARFTTWAYTIVQRTVSRSMERHPWNRGFIELVGEVPETARPGTDDLPTVTDAVRRVVETGLTSRQRRAFIGSVVEGRTVEELAEELGSNRNAVYKLLFDTRRKIRAALLDD